MFIYVLCFLNICYQKWWIKMNILLATVKARKMRYFGHIRRSNGRCLETEIIEGTLQSQSITDNLKTSENASWWVLVLWHASYQYRISQKRSGSTVLSGSRKCGYHTPATSSYRQLLYIGLVLCRLRILTDCLNQKNHECQNYKITVLDLWHQTAMNTVHGYQKSEGVMKWLHVK